jgi:tellurite resistance-related uncharacterized protein
MLGSLLSQITGFKNGDNMTRRFRIHGDNVVECERTLSLLAEGFSSEPELLQNSSPLHPEFQIKVSEDDTYVFEFLPGHGRWGIDLANGLIAAGSQLRENADSVITEMHGEEEKILIGLEYCGALPAGNQAWQRHGRALGYAQASVPYLIFTEVGGMELTSSRTGKASRLPNPATTFALLQMTRDLGTVVLPVYESAPSAPNSVKEKYEEAFGHHDALEIVVGAVKGVDTTDHSTSLAEKTLRMVQILADSRSRNDALAPSEWEVVLNSDDRFDSLGKLSSKYVRRSSDKVKSSKTMSKFSKATSKIGSLEFFSSSLPMTWIPKIDSIKFVQELEALYGKSLDFRRLLEGKKNIVIVFATGFKPRGDDSRPDRGLIPFGRMLTGPSDLVVTFLWGPAKAPMLKRLKKEYQEVAKANGLIEAVVAVSDFIIVDSVNHPPFLIDSRKTKSIRNDVPRITSTLLEPDINEHDVDSIIHFLATQPHRAQYFEGMCNPPGGDWSGISLRLDDFSEVRWTSLPRVSVSSAKRPDHVIQFHIPDGEFILAIESKLSASKMEIGVGPDLIRYLSDLTTVPPNVIRKSSVEKWNTYKAERKFKLNAPIYSAATFRVKKKSEMQEVLISADVNLVIGLEFEYEVNLVTIHLCTQKGFEFLAESFSALAISSSFAVKIHE